MSKHDLPRIIPSHAQLVEMAMASDEPEYITFSRIIEGMRNLTVADIEPLAAQLQHLCQMEER